MASGGAGMKRASMNLAGYNDTGIAPSVYVNPNATMSRPAPKGNRPNVQDLFAAVTENGSQKLSSASAPNKSATEGAFPGIPLHTASDPTLEMKKPISQVSQVPESDNPAFPGVRLHVLYSQPAPPAGRARSDSSESDSSGSEKKKKKKDKKKNSTPYISSQLFKSESVPSTFLSPSVLQI